MPGVQTSRLQPDELPAFLRAFRATFGGTLDDATLEAVRRVLDPARAVAARAPSGAIVGTAGAYDFTLSLPGGRAAGCAGVTLVSVRADHRRRGVLTRMLAEVFDDAAARGEPFAALWASEAPIYGRFGFGPAAPTLSVRLDRPHAALRLDGPVADVRLVDVDEALDHLPAIYDAVRRDRGGVLSRDEAWWRHRTLADTPEPGLSPLRVALLDGRGYALHRLRPNWEDGVPAGVVEVAEVTALDPEAAAALWRFVIDTDLAASVSAWRRPVDDPLLGLLVDPARAAIRADWPLYLRVLDVPAALAARGYAVDGEVVLDVADPAVPHNTGRWQLVVREGAATCEPTDAAADVHLDVEALSTIVLGGVRATGLAAAGWLRGAPDAVAGLDRLLATDLAPWHGGMF